MNDNWYTKYNLQNFDDMYHNKDKINKIIEWLNNHTKSLLLKGNVNSDKYHILNLIAKKFKYKLYIYKFYDIKKLSLLECYNSLLNKKKKFILIINNVDNVTISGEKKNIENLIKTIKISKIPIIYTVEKNITKFVGQIKVKTEYIELNNIPNIIIENIIKKIIINEKINILNKKIIIKNLIDLSQNDIKRCTLILKDLKLTFMNEKISLKKYNKFLKYNNKKELNLNILDITKMIINDYNFKKCSDYYNLNKVILPLLIYENFLNKISENYSKYNKSDILNVINKISNLLSIGDKLETNIYIEQNWYLQNIHGFITVVCSSFYLNNFFKKKKNINNNFNVVYSIDLNKTSLKNINKKNFINISGFIKNKTNNDILYISKFLIFLIKSNQFNKLIKLLNDYNINLKTLKIILKINKLDIYLINTEELNIIKKKLKN